MPEPTYFSPAIIENLGYYVYLLLHPDTNKVFYIGKGTGNRVFAHIEEATASSVTYDKLDVIRDILRQGKTVKYSIHRHGLTENEAFEVEAALIDFIGLPELTNRVHGNDVDRGPMLVADLYERYDAPTIHITEPATLIIINRTYRRGMSSELLYQITRGNWIVSGYRCKRAKYAFAVSNGIVRQVYEIHRWFQTDERIRDTNRFRWRFDGVIAENLQHYIGGNVAHYIKQGSQNPVKYINC